MPAKKKSTSTAKKAPVKKTASKPTPRVSAASATAATKRPFMEKKFTEQTIYWLIIGAAVIGIAAWVLSLQVRLDEMYDDIEAQSSEVVIPKKTTTQ